MGLNFKSALGSAVSMGSNILLPGSGDIVAGAVGLSSDQIQAEENLKQQIRLADHNFSKNLEMYNLNNAYNDPSAQMARLEAAGLNKNLVYGGGNVTGNTSGGIPTYNAGEYHPVDKSIQRQQLDLALKEHQQRITNQAIENELARERIGLATREADRQDRLAEAQIRAYGATMGLTNARIDDIVNNPVDRRTPTQKIVDDFKDIGESVGSKLADEDYIDSVVSDLPGFRSLYKAKLRLRAEREKARQERFNNARRRLNQGY